jgi:hypothetical protein
MCINETSTSFNYGVIYSRMFGRFTSRQKTIAGNISVVSNNAPGDIGYTLALYEDGINKNLLGEHICDLNGNDTVLLIKCIDEKCDDVYYKVQHNKGRAPTEVLRLKIRQYRKERNEQVIKYSFHDTAPCRAVLN